MQKGIVLEAVFFLVAVAWLWLLLRTRRALEAVPWELPPPTARDAWPPVSVLLPARNEEGRELDACLRSLAAQEHPEFEVVAVDDCSTDGTLAVLERAAAAIPRLRVIRGTPPPPGWLGKPWALEQARQAARFPLLLAADADVIWKPDALARGVHFFETRNLDALTLIPRLRLETFWERAALPVISWMLVVSTPFHKANDPQHPAALASGAFVLFRRAAHEALGGYGSVREKINEDAWTIRLLKRSGARVWAGDGSALLETRMYRGLREIVAGFGKSIYAASGNTPGGALRVGLCVVALGLLPPLALLALNFTLFLRRMRAPVSYAPAAPLGFAVALWTLLRAAWRIETRRGLEWKGRQIISPGS